MQDEDEGIHLAPGPEESRGRFVVVLVKVGIGCRHVGCVFVHLCIRAFVQGRALGSLAQMHIYTNAHHSSEAKIALSGRMTHFLTIINAWGRVWGGSRAGH